MNFLTQRKILLKVETKTSENLVFHKEILSFNIMINDICREVLEFSQPYADDRVY